MSLVKYELITYFNLHTLILDSIFQQTHTYCMLDNMHRIFSVDIFYAFYLILYIFCIENENANVYVHILGNIKD